MSKTFTYTKITEKVYLEGTDEYEEFGEDFEYEVDDEQLLDAVVDLVFDDYFRKTELVDISNYGYEVRKGIRKFIEDDYDLFEKLVEDYEDRLKDYFEEEAMEDY